MAGMGKPIAGFETEDDAVALPMDARTELGSLAFVRASTITGPQAGGAGAQGGRSRWTAWR